MNNILENKIIIPKIYIEKEAYKYFKSGLVFIKYFLAQKNVIVKQNINEKNLTITIEGCISKELTEIKFCIFTWMVMCNIPVDTVCRTEFKKTFDIVTTSKKSKFFDEFAKIITETFESVIKVDFSS